VTAARTLTDADVEALADAIALRLGRRRAKAEVLTTALDQVGARRAEKARAAAAAEVTRRGHGRRLK
jgi:hypothetical protein